jgi:DNA primase
MTAREIAHHLRGRKSGTGWSAKCPAHEDRNPSLSIGEKDGRILVHCHAGCDQDRVVDVLKARGLWPEVERHDLEADIEVVYNYTDAAGKLLYQIVRKRGKRFLQRYPDGRGGWIWKKHPQQVLYHLPEVVEAPIVFVVEGEKDVETLRSHGFGATTNAGGAKAPWLPQFTETLRGREVIIIPDNDEPGWERAKTIARGLLGQAARIRILDDIHRDGAKDITDWFLAGHSECELIARLDVHAV